jgi:hypothetical protein
MATSGPLQFATKIRCVRVLFCFPFGKIAAIQIPEIHLQPWFARRKCPLIDNWGAKPIPWGGSMALADSGLLRKRLNGHA